MAKLKKSEKLAIKAMMYAFERYGTRLVGAIYVSDRKTYPKDTMDFGEAYNICNKMVADNETIAEG